MLLKYDTLRLRKQTNVAWILYQRPVRLDVRHDGEGTGIPNSVRAKAGLPWPVSGTYRCDKCHSSQTGQAGVVATRCAVLRGEHDRPCNCAYFVLVANGSGGSAAGQTLKSLESEGT